MNRETVTITLIEAKGYEPEDVERDFNDQVTLIQSTHPGRLIGMDVQQIPAGPNWHLRAVLQFQTVLSYPDPEPEPEEQAARQAKLESAEKSLNTVLALASNISLLREAGIRGEGMNYGDFWKLVDAMTLQLRAMGGIVGDGVQDATT